MYTAWYSLGRRTRWVVPAVVALAACTDATSATDLHPGGPPMVQQIRMRERFSIGGVSGLDRVVFGFGTHPDATAEDEHPVTTALASGNKLRIIIDELLRGNDLEEIACRAEVADGGAFSRVPVGATPDDIARCAVAQDALPARCPGSNRLSVCICAKDAGCPAQDGKSVTPRGESVGVADVDSDGAADNTRFLPGAVGIRCGAIDVPIDLDMSTWTPSGNQQKPAQGGFDALGPAIVLVPGLVPGRVPAALPTGADCGVVFSSEVVDKDGNQVCAPPGGDITAGCTPGDTSAIRFTVEPLRFAISSVFSATAQSRTADIKIRANVPLDPASVATVTVTEDPATNYTEFTAILGAGTASDEITIHWTVGLAASTHYTITLPTTVTDAYHQPVKQPMQIAFTTSAT